MHEQINHIELAVVGAGPAVIAAAVTAAEAGVQVALLDECAGAGGRFLHRGPPDADSRQFTGLKSALSRGEGLLARLAKLPVVRLPQTQVWGVSGPKRLGLYREGRVLYLQPGRLIVATGSYETNVPFPGWELPGVMTAGGAQALVRKHLVRPGQRVMVAGSGPFLWLVAVQMVEAGVEVAGVLEATRPSEWTSFASHLRSAWDRVKLGLKCRSELKKAGVPVMFGRTVTRASGDSKLEAVESAEVSPEGRVLAGTQEEHRVDCLATGSGFVPSTEVTRLAGCHHEFRAESGGWCPVVNERQGTTVAGLYAAGETAGIGGAEKAMTEGEIAGLAAAESLGALDTTKARTHIERLLRSLKPLKAFATTMNTVFQSRPGVWESIPDETIICRCESITAGEIRTAAGSGCTTLNEIKRCTRSGMGRCQGRLCGPIASQLLASATGREVEAGGTLIPRPPLSPVPLGAFVQE